MGGLIEGDNCTEMHLSTERFSLLYKATLSLQKEWFYKKELLHLFVLFSGYYIFETCKSLFFKFVIYRIQAAWRGYVVRCWYKKFREEVPPNDPNLKKKFYQEKV